MTTLMLDELMRLLGLVIFYGYTEINAHFRLFSHKYRAYDLYLLSTGAFFIECPS